MARQPMGLPRGVEIIGQSVRIRFMWDGQRRCETLAYPATAKGIKSASGLRDQVVQAIKYGIMDDAKYAEFFPNSAIAEEVRGVIPLFGEYAQLWLDSREIVLGTRDNYKSTLNLYWMPHLAFVRINLITVTMLRRIVTATEWSSASVKRNALIKLSSIMEGAIKDGLISKNPVASIEMPRRSKKIVDPFSREEAEQIIAYLYASLGKYSRIYAALYEFLFFTGMRPGEAFALRWDEVDEEARRAHVCRIVVDRGIEERVKTKNERDVLLNERALHALKEAKRIAKIKQMASVSEFANSPFVFPPSKGGLWIKEPSVTIKHFYAALDALGIRRRRQYDARHTYATMCLMAGMNPAFIAGQLGHSVQMLLTTYAKWISSASDWNELNKLPARIKNGMELVQDEDEGD
ncbi:tyrosine-type recombinase/integrase [Pseudomonas tohonis]|uniref:site-specific integrase n=1 Tax=Pseudomonas sp. zfem005 TaxID=3078200 RepID=UPI0003981BE3|nr:site-specific integrase [Pseudomonas sp. zfem005]EQM72086.1 integrase [Pseudomonas alcaligenes OT 69]MDN4146003.1 tyrosine-type recombinase/integrase [Pseudomonas tohonis]MDU9415337.1 tyrosine-type recombinase/integrase [Pseudomonas sp. zfem005]